MKKSELKQIIQEEIKAILEAEDPANIGMKKAMGFEKPTNTVGNRFKTVKPTGKITVMNWDSKNGEYIIDVNDDVYKDEDERALRTTFSMDELEVENTSDIINFIESNRDRLTWRVVSA
jgi:hypothetical protein